MCISPKLAINLKPPAHLKVRGTSDHEFQLILRNSNDQVERLGQQRLQVFLDQQPAFEKAIEIQQLRYPYHLLEFKLAQKSLLPGLKLKVISQSSILIDDLAAACRILKIPTKTLRFRKQFFIYVTQTSGASVHVFRKQTSPDTIINKRSA